MSSFYLIYLSAIFCYRRETATRLAEQEDKVVEKITKLFEMKDDSFQTVAHGDSWTCNLMFKYCPYDDKLPIAVK